MLQDDWDDDTVMVTIEKMRIEKGRDTGNVSVMDLGKFNPGDFETHESAFINLLAQLYGVQSEILSISMRDVVIPPEFVYDAEWHMYQLPLTGEAYSMDNKSVYHLLKSFQKHFLHGQVITMVKVSYQRVWQWQRQGSKVSSTRMSAVCHLRR
jgi:hypothetical protein